MSLTEAVMLVVLGFAMATFIALIAGRIAWKLAFRLGAKRNQKSIPSTVAELQSDRDRLRAEHAMMATKLEVRFEEMKMRSAEQSAEVTRHRNRTDALAQELAARNELVKERDAQLLDRNAELVNLQAQIKTLERELEFQADQYRELQARQSLPATETPVIASQARIAELPEKPTVHTTVIEPDRLQSRIQELTSLSAQIAKQRDVETPVRGVSLDNTVFVKPAGGTSFQTIPQAEPVIDQSPAKLQNELTRFDEAWQETPVAAEAEAASPAEPEKPRRAVTNVIALAKRIKALHKTITN